MNRPARLLIPFVALIAVAIALPAAAQPDAAADVQTIQITDVRTGDAPCGFPIQREITGAVSIEPSVDGSGHLVLRFARVDLRGTLTNPATGAALEIKWVKTNGSTIIAAAPDSATIALSLTGVLFRGYSTDPTNLDLGLPADGGTLIEFEPGGSAPDPWAYACGRLS